MTEMEQRVFLPGPGVNDIQNDHDDDDQEEPVLPKLSLEFEKFPLVIHMQYSLRLYEILRDMDRMHHRMDVFLGALGCTPRDIGIYRANYERRPSWAYYVTMEILDQVNRPEMAKMNLLQFVQILAKVPETRIIRRDIAQFQNEILEQFRAQRLVQIPAVLIYRRDMRGTRAANEEQPDAIETLKRQMANNNFQVTEIHDILQADQEAELRRADAIFIVFDEEMNTIFDETTAYVAAPGDVDYRHIGRVLYHDYLVNDCRNERLYLFVTQGLNANLQETFKFPWMLRENNLHFANEQDGVNRTHINRVRTYARPAVLPAGAGYVKDANSQERQAIDNLLGRFYKNHNRPNRRLR